ncbi:glycosyl transferase [Gigaspora margarita]|uniref:Alpha-1,4 glucan phosphorylase n=1 Tax=Gigaspora margarita TaxID=4874 RepID=A0A8H3X800_GIGMA|nr:glycosyl transferase [Gigaspora margarita]
MDSLASLSSLGYDLRYLCFFQQRLKDGYQVEFPDYWLHFDNSWELPRLDVIVDVQFAVANDVPIPGYGTKNCINIRLWSMFFASKNPKNRGVAIQLNDSHPTLDIVELQRILDLELDETWEIVTRMFAFTNHTIFPEAMEKWPIPMVPYLLPRHMQIIFDLNLVEKLFPDNRDLLAKLSIIEKATPQFVRLVLVYWKMIFKDFVKFYGSEKFTNVTNGITPRRWLH